jgi:cellobiose phosphorylase
VEPYVVAADVYAVAPHIGRGGWTWYTGSAGWMYRLLVETLLGVNLEGDKLRLVPRMPKSWPSYKIHYRYRQTVYHITFTRITADTTAANQLFLDGQEVPGEMIHLVDDHKEHAAEMTGSSKNNYKLVYTFNPTHWPSGCDRWSGLVRTTEKRA